MTKTPNLDNLIPNIWEGNKVRNNIKSKHQSNLVKLESGDYVELNFDREKLHTLGDRARKHHFRTVEKIKSEGHSSGSEYTLYDQEDRKEIEKLTEKTIFWIKITNIVYTLLFLSGSLLLTVLLTLSVLLAYSALV